MKGTYSLSALTRHGLSHRSYSVQYVFSSSKFGWDAYLPAGLSIFALYADHCCAAGSHCSPGYVNRGIFWSENSINSSEGFVIMGIPVYYLTQKAEGENTPPIVSEFPFPRSFISKV